MPSERILVPGDTLTSFWGRSRLQPTGESAVVFTGPDWSYPQLYIEGGFTETRMHFFLHVRQKESSESTNSSILKATLELDSQGNVVRLVGNRITSYRTIDSRKYAIGYYEIADDPTRGKLWQVDQLNPLTMQYQPLITPQINALHLGSRGIPQVISMTDTLGMYLTDPHLQPSEILRQPVAPARYP